MITESNLRLVSNKVLKTLRYLKIVKITHLFLPFCESFSYFITSKGCAKRTTFHQFLESLNQQQFHVTDTKTIFGWMGLAQRERPFLFGAMGFNQFMTDKWWYPSFFTHSKLENWQLPTVFVWFISIDNKLSRCGRWKAIPSNSTAIDRKSVV